jgi:drug/metabolite transporter (DMT)-like permease
MFAFATTYPLSKFAVGRVSPYLTAAIRNISACLILIPFYLRERKKLPSPVSLRDGVLINLVGLSGGVVFAVLLLVGISLSNASNSSLLINTQPVFAVFLAPLILKEKFSLVKLLSAIVGIAGLFFVVTGGSTGAFVLSGKPLIGNCLLLIASVCMTLYTLLLKPYVVRYGGTIPTFMGMITSTVIFIVLILIPGFRSAGLDQAALGPTRIWGPEGLSPGIFAIILYTGIIGTALAYVLFNKSMAILSFTTATAYKVLVPVFGVLLSLLFLGEDHSWQSYMGMVIVFISLSLIVLEPILLRKD